MTVEDVMRPRRTGVRSDSNTIWGSKLAGVMRQIARTAASRSDRSQQVHLGPSEIGHPCDRQVAGKLAGLGEQDSLSDPWPSIIGTAVHAWLADAFEKQQPDRFLAEKRVTPIDGHSGTADLYDAETQTVIDHKILGDSTHKKLISQGPSRTYLVQLLLYARGYQLAGYQVDRVAIAAWPRTKPSMSGLYVWGLELSEVSDRLLAEVVGVELPRRKEYARLLQEGSIGLLDVPSGGVDCHFCPFLSREGGESSDQIVGCPGR